MRSIRVDSEGNVVPDRMSRLFEAAKARSSELETIQHLNKVMPGYLLVNINAVVVRSLRGMESFTRRDAHNHSTTNTAFQRLEEEIVKVNLSRPVALSQVNIVS